MFDSQNRLEILPLLPERNSQKMHSEAGFLALLGGLVGFLRRASQMFEKAAQASLVDLGVLK